MDAAKDDLQHCRREVLRLLAENAALRYAAKSFGDLAERLNLIVSRHRLGLLTTAFGDHGSNPCMTDSTMAKTSDNAATPSRPQRTDDYSATRAPENQEHVESRIPFLDQRLHPGGAHAVPVDPGITDLHRSDVPGLDTVDEPHDGRPAGDRRD